MDKNIEALLREGDYEKAIVYLKRELELNPDDPEIYSELGVAFYEIQNAENVVDTTDKTIGGFKSYWKRVTAVPVKEDVVPFLNETKGS